MSDETKTPEMTPIPQPEAFEPSNVTHLMPKLTVGVETAIRREIQKAEKAINENVARLFEQHSLEISKATAKTQQQILDQINRVVGSQRQQLGLLAVDVREQNQDIYNLSLRLRAIADVMGKRLVNLEHQTETKPPVGALTADIIEQFDIVTKELDARMAEVHQESEIIHQKKLEEAHAKAMADKEAADKAKTEPTPEGSPANEQPASPDSSGQPENASGQKAD